jgi:multidrug efflux pump subunit AcrB
MVLAIGLLVDDAIVVVENVERVMAEEHLSAKLTFSPVRHHPGQPLKA